MQQLAPVFDAVVWTGMLLLGLLIPVLTACLLSRQPRLLSMAVLMWLGLSAGLAHAGLLLNTHQLPPVIAGLVAVPLAFLVLTVRRPNAGVWRQGVSLRMLLGIQIFRLPLELLMWRAAQLGIMPIEFSFQGYNLDVITGLGALLLVVLWPYVSPQRAKQLAWVWNLWGIFCLLAISALVVLLSPQVHFFGQGPQHINSWVLFFPYVWLPSLLVPCAVLGHLLVWRELSHKA
jgi:hypothetical protein